MTGKRIKHEKISDERKRNITFEKMANGLMEKADELSTLCGVDIGIVVHKQGGEANSILWPSPPIFKERMQKFLDFPEEERTKRMVTHEKYLEQTLAMERENLLATKKKNEVKESQQVMNGLVTKGKHFNELDVNQLNSLNTFAVEMLNKLEKMGEVELNEENQQVQPLPYYPLPKWPSFLTSGEQQMDCGTSSPNNDGGVGTAGGSTEKTT